MMKALLLVLVGLAASASAGLSVVSVSPQPGSIAPGQLITVSVQVSNSSGSGSAFSVSTSVEAIGSGGAAAALSASPSPVAQDIAPFGAAYFTWVFQGSGCGQVAFSANATGIFGSATITSATLSSGPVNLACTPGPTPTITPTATQTPWVIYVTPVPTPGVGDASIPGNLFHPNGGQPLQLKFDAPSEGAVSIDIYNRLGLKVRSISRTVQPGSYTELWDGRSDQGILVASGIYVAQFHGKNLAKIVKFAVIK